MMYIILRMTCMMTTALTLSFVFFLMPAGAAARDFSHPGMPIMLAAQGCIPGIDGCGADANVDFTNCSDSQITLTFSSRDRGTQTRIMEPGDMVRLDYEYPQSIQVAVTCQGTTYRSIRSATPDLIPAFGFFFENGQGQFIEGSHCFR